MDTPVLVIMAAGIGSRYGGLKQIDPIDDQNHLIIDFSIYDAIKAGFKKVIFIIKQEIEADFKERIGDRISRYVQVEYVYQDIGNIPAGFNKPEGRVKPWGTGHAILSCFEKINGPFAVINADDYYGQSAFELIYDRLTNTQDDDKYSYCMVGYVIENTLTDHGHVARGVCTVGSDGYLKSIKERTRIEKYGNGSAFTEDNGNTWAPIPQGSIVSMNMWGFTKSILSELNNRFIRFLEESIPNNPLKSEYFLPDVVGELLKEEKAKVQVLKSLDKWYGVTYKEDKGVVVSAIAKLKKNGVYPEKLWD